VAKTTVIGLDIGSTGVRAAELELGSGPAYNQSATLVRAGQVPVPLGAVRDGEVIQQDVVAHAIKHLWSSAKFVGHDVVLGVGNQRVLVRETDLPMTSLDRLRDSLKYQVSDTLPMPADEALLDFHAVAQSTTAQGPVWRGLLVAAQRATVNGNVVAAEAAGLRPTRVDLNAFALVRVLARDKYFDKVVGLVDVGAAITTVTVMVAGQPRIVRMLPTGGQSVTQAVAAALSVPVQDAELAKSQIGIGFRPSEGAEGAAEAITGVVRSQVESIRNTFVYYQQSAGAQAIDVVVLTGGGANLPGYGQYLSSASRLPVVLGDPLSTVRIGKSVDRESMRDGGAELTTAIGLALGGHA
jgi:type IV pilus assembly protein PilM